MPAGPTAAPVVPPTLELVKTVGLDPGLCASTDEVDIVAGEKVTYCYVVRNTSVSNLVTHSLVDDELGTLLTNFPYVLAPDASVFITKTVVINNQRKLHLCAISIHVWGVFLVTGLDKIFEVYDDVTPLTDREGKPFVIGKPDEVNMEVVKAFVTLNPGYEPSEDLELAIMNFIRKKLSPLAMPQEIEFVEKVPKTRSGKILRRVLKAKELGQPIGDVSTMEDD